MLIVKVLPFLMLWVQAYTYNILCLITYPGKTHYVVFEPLLQELQARGHNLTVVSFFPSRTKVANRRDVDLRTLASSHAEIINLQNVDYTFFGFEKYFEHFPVPTFLAKSNLQLCQKVLDSTLFDEFVAAKGDYDLILVQYFNSDCMLGIIHNYGLPFVGLMSTGLLPWTPQRVGAPGNPAHVPELVLPFTAEMNFFERLQNTIWHYIYAWWFEIVIRWKEQKILEKKLGRRLPKLEDVGKNVSAVLISTYHVSNGVRSLPPSVVEVGGIHLYNKSLQPLQQELNKWISEAENGFIVFSFGSLIRMSTLPKKRLAAILNVFARLKYRIVWKWEDNMADVPDNVLIMKWLPQYDLLQHKNCVGFISHGGLLSITEAVSVGVPMLVVPILGDQFGNAAHVEQGGIAQVLRLQNLDEQTFEASLKQVLSNEMRQRARTVSEMWRDRLNSPMESAVYHIERTARYKGLNMSSHARWLSASEYTMLDIVGFLVATIVVAFVTIRSAIRKCQRHPKAKQN